MIRIISDSTSDLSKELIEKYNISILPLHIHLGEEEYEDGVNITPAEIFRWSDENKTTPKTSAVSLGEALDMFQSYPEDELICFSISDSMSTTGNVMRMAAAELEREDTIHVIDSANLSSGIAMLVIEAANMIQEGKSAAEIVQTIEEMKQKVRTSFVVDTLTYLHRGGRCGSIAALAGSVLSLHPRIAVESGKMDAGKKYRGKMPVVIMSYVKDMEQELKNAKADRVILVQAGCSEEIINKVYTYLKDLQVFDEVLVMEAGSVISSHCGPGTLGVIFMER